MITAAEPLPKKTPQPGRKTAASAAEERVLLTGIRWETYQALLADLGDRPIHLTYDRGSLEIMTLSSAHESYKTLFGRLVELLTLELRIPIRSLGSTTLNREQLQRGLEGDECYYITNEPKVRAKLHIDLAVDPPPDLALEVDVTHSSLDRLSIYAVLRVPELWRREGETLVCYLLGNDGKYVVSSTSRAFPGLTPADLMRFLLLRGQMDENALVRRFRAWVQQQFPRQSP